MSFQPFQIFPVVIQGLESGEVVTSMDLDGILPLYFYSKSGNLCFFGTSCGHLLSGSISDDDVGTII
jgi:hypothetical protein